MAMQVLCELDKQKDNASKANSNGNNNYQNGNKYPSLKWHAEMRNTVKFTGFKDLQKNINNVFYLRD